MLSALVIPFAYGAMNYLGADPVVKAGPTITAPAALVTVIYQAQIVSGTERLVPVQTIRDRVGGGSQTVNGIPLPSNPVNPINSRNPGVSSYSFPSPTASPSINPAGQDESPERVLLGSSAHTLQLSAIISLMLLL